MRIFSIIFSLFFLSSLQANAQQPQYKVHSIAFYNLENLFDIERDSTIYDEAFTPSGSYGWNKKKYNNKLENLSTVLSEIGTNSNMKSPAAIIGVCEIENKKVLEDLIAMPKLKNYNYGIVHKESPDERGIDTGLLYRKDLFKVSEYKTYFVELPDTTDRTRDILMVRGDLEGEEIFVFVNHWPSRSGGEKMSMPNRAAAAKTLRTAIDEILIEKPKAKFFLLGDFNDDPVSPSLAKILNAKKQLKKTKGNDLYNPYYDFYRRGDGTTAWRDAWSLFDMVIVSNSAVNENPKNGWKFAKAGKFNPDYMIQSSGRFKGYPLRTHSFGTYLNGYSDHFPVYVYVIKQVK